MSDKLPDHFVKQGIEEAETMTLYGVPLTDLTRDELLAGCAIGWKSYNEQIQSSIQSMEMLRTMRGAR